MVGRFSQALSDDLLPGIVRATALTMRCHHHCLKRVPPRSKKRVNNADPLVQNGGTAIRSGIAAAAAVAIGRPTA